MSGDDIDIVERLCRLWDWLAGSGTAADELLDAADEVERLRAAGDALVDAVLLQRWSTVDVAVAAWLEARRG